MATVAGHRGGSEGVGQRDSHPAGLAGHARQGHGRSGHRGRPGQARDLLCRRRGFQGTFAGLIMTS